MTAILTICESSGVHAMGLYYLRILP